MKEIFRVRHPGRCAGPFHDFYAALLAKGIEPEMARLDGWRRKIGPLLANSFGKRKKRSDANNE